MAVAIGAVVGIERHWRERDEPDGHRAAGLRTFTLVGMLGGTAGLIARSLANAGSASGIVIVGFFVAFSAVFAVFQLRDAIADKTYSATSVIAAMVTFALGVIAVNGDTSLASAGGVALVAILASREFLHAFMRRLTWIELRSAIILLGMTFLVLPLVPSEPVGPFGGISLSETWLLAIILAGISFCGYIAVRLLGSRRGELVAGAIGGLISSTAATVTNARRSTSGENAPTLAAGALGACAVSYARTALLVAMLAPPLVRDLIPPLLAAAAAMTACAVALARMESSDHPEQPAENPFDLDTVIKMALMLVVIAFMARAAASWFGDAGVVIVAALSGLADVDAATVTIAGMEETLPASLAALAIGAAVISNTVAKATYATVFGTRAFYRRFILASLAALAAGSTVYWLVAKA
ncbi:MgtC/SapB family protein [Mesorhizobium sp. LHD-90]|uniref:MgtC/SapB family protein n=1 Tax=Mesorhizobium sp. LHD-90 TaxID=3071414 RepID=UPI0027E13492|nr:MgtC/SapB family protein [Mesorhizobium sp. LHD-90]MDQ6437266.1 MgtC/SapB family protein [Mesorhizobium sp. LHD-90]